MMALATGILAHPCRVLVQHVVEIQRRLPSHHPGFICWDVLHHSLWCFNSSFLGKLNRFFFFLSQLVILLGLNCRFIHSSLVEVVLDDSGGDFDPTSRDPLYGAATTDVFERIIWDHQVFMGEEKLEKHLSIYIWPWSFGWYQSPRARFMQPCLVVGKQTWHWRAPALDRKGLCQEEQRPFGFQIASCCWAAAVTLEISLQSSKTWHLPSKWLVEEVVCWKLVASEICQSPKAWTFHPLLH